MSYGPSARAGGSYHVARKNRMTDNAVVNRNIIGASYIRSHHIECEQYTVVPEIIGIIASISNHTQNIAGLNRGSNYMISNSPTRIFNAVCYIGEAGRYRKIELKTIKGSGILNLNTCGQRAVGPAIAIEQVDDVGMWIYGQNPPKCSGKYIHDRGIAYHGIAHGSRIHTIGKRNIQLDSSHSTRISGESNILSRISSNAKFSTDHAGGN